MIEPFGCRCPHCGTGLTLKPEAYDYCPVCRGRFSFAKPIPTDTPTQSLLTSTGKPKVQFVTGATRDDRTGKGRYDLLPTEALRRIAIRYEIGASNHGAHNWEKGMPMARLLDSAIRHLFSYLDGARDEDHLAAAGWNIMGLIHHERELSAGRLPKSLADHVQPRDNNEHQRYLAALGYTDVAPMPTQKTNSSTVRDGEPQNIQESPTLSVSAACATNPDGDDYAPQNQ